MKKLNVLLITGLVLLFTCGTALAYATGPANGGTAQQDQTDQLGATSTVVSPVPEPTTILLLGSGLAALAVGARKKKK